MPLLSILICSLNKRLPELHILLRHLTNQITDPAVVEIVDPQTDNGELPTGTKRNNLVNLATGEYIVFIDDDDWVSDDYVPQILTALESRPDAVGFKGYMTTDNARREDFSISRFNPYTTTIFRGKRFYQRYNNHLSPVKRSIALQYPFKDIYHGEDEDYATRMHNANAIQTEVMIHSDLYFYRYKTKK